MGTADGTVSRHCCMFHTDVRHFFYFQHDDVFFEMLLVVRADCLKEVNVCSLST